MHNNNFQVQLGQIVHVHQAIFVISCKNMYILVFLYVQIQGCEGMFPIKFTFLVLRHGYKLLCVAIRVSFTN